MKKIISIVLTGAFMLSLSACSSGSRSVASTTTTTEATTTKATTTTTTEETTTEETTTASSSETEKSFDEQIPSDGEVYVDFSNKGYSDISENILKALRLRTNTTADSYAKRFSTTPKYTYSKGVWTFDWGKKKLNTDTFEKITIKAGKDGDKIVLDKFSSIKIKFFIEDRDIGDGVYEGLIKRIKKDGESPDYLKDGLAINPKRSGLNISRLYRYVKYDYKWVEITVACDILSTDR